MLYCPQCSHPTSTWDDGWVSGQELAICQPYCFFRRSPSYRTHDLAQEALHEWHAADAGPARFISQDLWDLEGLITGVLISHCRSRKEKETKSHSNTFRAGKPNNFLSAINPSSLGISKCPSLHTQATNKLAHVVRQRGTSELGQRRLDAPAPTVSRDASRADGLC